MSHGLSNSNFKLLKKISILATFNLCLRLDLPNKRYSDQFRHYARAAAANVDVGEPRTVRLIYLLPNDRPYRAEVVERLKTESRFIQDFYAQDMQAHSYGDITFRTVHPYFNPNVQPEATGPTILHSY